MKVLTHMSTIEAQELEERLSRIRLPVRSLARRVECHVATIANHAKGQSQMNDRLQRDVRQALDAEERELLAYLVRLHPDQARAALQAA